LTLPPRSGCRTTLIVLGSLSVGMIVLLVGFSPHFSTERVFGVMVSTVVLMGVVFVSLFGSMIWVIDRYADRLSILWQMVFGVVVVLLCLALIAAAIVLLFFACAAVV
jgi:hypothetical protein